MTLKKEFSDWVEEDVRKNLYDAIHDKITTGEIIFMIICFIIPAVCYYSILLKPKHPEVQFNIVLLIYHLVFIVACIIFPFIAIVLYRAYRAKAYSEIDAIKRGVKWIDGRDND